MATSKPRRQFRLILLLLVLIVGGYLSMGWLERTVLQRSQDIEARLGGPGSTIHIGSVDFKLLPGDIRWRDVLIEQPVEDPDTASGDRPMRVSGRVQEVSVRGLSYWRLLFVRTLSMRSITVLHPDIEMILMNDSTVAAEPSSGSKGITSLNADSLVLEDAVFRMHRTGDSMDLSVDTIDLHITGLRSNWTKDEPFELHFGAAMGQVRGIHATLPPVYDLRVARIDLDPKGGALHVMDVALKPRKGPQEYDKIVHFETDLFDVHVDTAMMDGLDLLALVNERTLRAGAMRVAGVELNIYRDKTMPDPAFKHKPLPSRLLRSLPIDLCMDSLVVDRWNVRYHEKNTLTPDFGEVGFSDIHGVVEGLCTVDTLSTDTLFVRATARCYDKANVALNVGMVIADPSDRFTVNAKIGGLPFEIFNRMTGDLLLVRATAGTIGGVDLTMTADNDRATGRVDMEYDGLQVELLKQDGSGEKRKFLSGLMNQVVHTRNLRSDPGFRHGDFTFERRKDRAIFNYLWSGLREGMIATVLPGILEDARQLDKPRPKK